MPEVQDSEFLKYIVENIVGNPNDVSVERTVDERGVLLTLDINPADMGYVIGRQGKTAQAIRSLLKIIGAKNNARVNLKINEPEGSTRPQRPERTERPERVERTEEEVDTSSVDDLKI